MRAHSLSRLPVHRILCALVLVSSAPSVAGDFDPLPVSGAGPLGQIYGLPAFDSARLLPRGRLQARITFEAASHFVAQESAGEALVLDGETHRLSVVLKYRTRAGEWGIVLPYVSHSGGFLDGFIETWHDVFGLAQSGRDAAPRDRLDYRYRRNGSTRLQLESAARGIGDVRVLAGWPLAAGGATAAAVRASLKLPTGDAAGLHGSGAPDLALWMAAGCGRCAPRWGWNATGGLLVLGRGEVLPELQRSVAAFAGVGAGWRAGKRIVLKAELRGHTPFYRRTDIRALDKTSLQLVLGGSWRISARTLLDAAVTEDVRVETAPDVSFVLSLRALF